MPNQITKFTKYLTLLDEVYKKASVTSVLDSDDSLVQEGSNAHTLKIPKITLDGLADYSRSAGYTGGDADLTFEEKSFNYERGRKFTVDAVDDIDTVGLMSANIMATFLREKVVPEVDAFRFAKYCSLAPSGNKVAETITAANVIEKITDHIYTSFVIVLMFIGYVNYGGRFIFTTIILYFATALIFFVFKSYL